MNRTSHPIGRLRLFSFADKIGSTLGTYKDFGAHRTYNNQPRAKVKEERRDPHAPAAPGRLPGGHGLITVPRLTSPLRRFA